MNKLEALWQYHNAEQDYARLEAHLKSTPSRTKLNKLHSFLTEQQNLISQIQRQIESRKDVYSRLAAQFQELERQFELELSEFNTMQSDEECTAAEMAESRKALEVLSDKLTAARRELSDTISWLETSEAEYKATFAKASMAKKEYDTTRVECEEELKQLQPELDAAKAQADKLAGGIDPAILKRYAAIKSRHVVPMAIVENSQCGGCRMMLPTVVVKRVAAGIDIVECESCGRILYAKD